MEFKIQSFLSLAFLVLTPCRHALALENTGEYFLLVSNHTQEEAKNNCESSGRLLLAGNMVDETHGVKEYMKEEGINVTWLNMTGLLQHFTSAGNVQTEPKDSTHNCLAVRWNNTPALKHVHCYWESITGFLCQTSECSLCPTWSCHQLNKSCLVKRCGAPTWYHARAACRAAGGDLWNATDTKMIENAMKKMTVKDGDEFWIGLNAESWNFGTDRSGREHAFPSQVLFPRKDPGIDFSMDHNTCFVLDVSSEPVWKPRDCRKRAPAICVNKTGNGQQSTSPITQRVTERKNGTTTTIGNSTAPPTQSVKDRQVIWIIIVTSLGSTLLATFVVICICICSRKRPKTSEEVFWAGNNMGEVPQWWTLKGPRIASEYAMPEGYYQDPEDAGPDADRRHFDHRAYFPGLEPNWTSPVAKSIEVLPSCHLETGNQTFNTAGRHSRLIVSSKGYTEVERELAKRAKLQYSTGNDLGKALYTAVWSRGKPLPENREFPGTQNDGYNSQNMAAEYDVPAEIAGQIPDDQIDDYFQPIGHEDEIEHGIQEPEPVYFLPDSSGAITKELQMGKSSNAKIAQMTFPQPQSPTAVIPIYTQPLQFKQQLGITSGSHFGSVPRLAHDDGYSGAVPEDNYDIPDKSIFATWRGKRGKPSPALFDTQKGHFQAEELMKANPPSRPPRTHHHLFMPAPVFIGSPGSAEDVYEDMTGKRPNMKPSNLI